MAQVILTLVLYAVRVIAAPAWQPLSTASHIEGNNTLQPGLVPDHEPTVKRTVYWMCAFDDPESFSVTLDGAFEDAYTMVMNMVDNLDLAISLHDSETGELLQTKRKRDQRTFDEHNAWATYSQFINKLWWGAGDARNLVAFDRLKTTRARASNAQSQLGKYLAGQGGSPDVGIYCSDDQMLSTTTPDGMTVLEEHSTWTNPTTLGGATYYWLSQADGVDYGERTHTWVLRPSVCDLGDGQTTRFDGVPVGTQHAQTVTLGNFDLIDESIIFCPKSQQRWMQNEEDRTASRVHYRHLHVNKGEEPTEDQLNLAQKLMDEYATKGGRTYLEWFSSFAVQVVLHEIMHTVAFSGSASDRMKDLKCWLPNSDGTIPEAPNSNDIEADCMFNIAQEKYNTDSAGSSYYNVDRCEAFSKYAMATYVNAVTWYKSLAPKARSDWNT